MKLYSMSLQVPLGVLTLILYFNLLYEAIFYVLKSKTSDQTFLFLISIFFMKLYSMSYLKTEIHNPKALAFQSSLWSYILCPSCLLDHILEYSCLFQSSLWSYILCPSRWGLFFRLPKKFQSSLWSYILCPSDDMLRIKIQPQISIFFMKLYSMSLYLSPFYSNSNPWNFNLLYEAIFYVLI